MSLVLENRRLSRGVSLLGAEDINLVTQQQQQQQQQNNASEASLPSYTLFYIFNLLKSRKEINTCKMVSKLWKTVASDACFGWFHALSLPIVIRARQWSFSQNEGPNFPFDYTREITTGTPVEFATISVVPTVAPTYREIYGYSYFRRGYDGNNERAKTKRPTKYLIQDKNGIEIFSGFCYTPGTYNTREGVADSKEYNGKNGISSLWDIFSEQYLIDIVETCKNNPRIWRYELLKVNLSDVNIAYVFTLEVNIREAEKMVDNGEVIPMTDIIAYNAYRENISWAQKQLTDIKYDKAHIPAKPFATQKQPLGFSKSIKLYKYQLDAVSWMKSIEEDVSVGFEVTHAIPWRAAKTSILFNYPYINEVVSVKNLKTEHVYPKGGILADDMGLGKTTEIIALILANPGDPSAINLAQYQAEYIARESQQKFNTDEPGDLFPTNATLVICPDHLLKQWHEEIEKNTRPHLNVVVLADFKSMKSCPYGDIINADAVIFARSLLTHDSYLNLGNYKCASFPRDHRINNYLGRLWHASATEMMDIRGPVLEHFNWRRIVCDEAHELTKDELADNLTWFSAEYWWYVSGTPFPDLRVNQKIPRFLDMPAGSSTIKACNFADIFVNNLYWRNTKESVKNEYEVPPIVEDLVLLDLTPVEKIGLLMCSTWAMKLAISHPGLGHDCGPNTTLTELRAKFIATLEKQRISLRNDLDYNQKDLEENERKRVEVEDTIKKRLEVNENKLLEAEIRKQYKGSLEYAATRIKYITDNIARLTGGLERNADLRDKLKAMEIYSGADMSKEAAIPELDEAEQKAAEQKQAEEKPTTTEGEKPTDGEQAETKNEKSGEETLPFSVIVDMTVVQLKAELAKRGIETNNKQRKADLQKVLKEAVKNNIQPIEEKAEKDSKKRKKETTTNSKSAKKAKVEVPSKPEEKDKDAARTTDDKVREQNVLKWLVEKEGTKLGNLIFYLRRLWDDNPVAKIIIFSQNPKVLDKISAILDDLNVNNTSLEGNVQKQAKQLSTFKKDSVVRVLLLNVDKVSAGTNIIEATHIMFMEPLTGNQVKAKEAQAIARAFRQGQTVQVTVVRFVVRETEEYTAHIANHGAVTENVPGTPIKRTSSLTLSGTPKFQRTSSIITTIATTPALQNTNEMVRLLEEKGDQEIVKEAPQSDDSTPAPTTPDITNTTETNEN